jgi:hypothetical protein
VKVAKVAEPGEVGGVQVEGCGKGFLRERLLVDREDALEGDAEVAGAGEFLDESDAGEKGVVSGLGRGYRFFELDQERVEEEFRRRCSTSCSISRRSSS